MQKIILSVENTNVILNTSDIMYLKADSNYCNIVCQKNKYLVPRTLKEFEVLEPLGFLRINRFYIVNTDAMTKISEGFIHLVNGEKIEYAGIKKDLISKLNFFKI